MELAIFNGTYRPVKQMRTSELFFASLIVKLQKSNKQHIEIDALFSHWILYTHLIGWAFCLIWEGGMGWGGGMLGLEEPEILKASSERPSADLLLSSLLLLSDPWYAYLSRYYSHLWYVGRAAIFFCGNEVVTLRWRTISESTLSCFTDPTASIFSTFTTDPCLSGG